MGGLRPPSGLRPLISATVGCLPGVPPVTSG